MLAVMELEFEAELAEWRGPAPFYYLRAPEGPSDLIASLAREITYGWGAIPVRVRVADTEWTTSLFPKGGRYLIPVKDAVRRPLGLALGDVAEVWLRLGR